jgi:hypothetical protein
MTGETPAHTFIFTLAALQADQLLHELESLAEADDSFTREGSNTSLFTRKYNAVVKLLRLLPEEEREAILVLLRRVLERVAEGVKPVLKRVGRKWRRTIKNAGYLRDDSTFREAVNRAVSSLPAPNLKEMRKEERKTKNQLVIRSALRAPRCRRIGGSCWQRAVWRISGHGFQSFWSPP